MPKYYLYIIYIFKDNFQFVIHPNASDSIYSSIIISSYHQFYWVLVGGGYQQYSFYETRYQDSGWPKKHHRTHGKQWDLDIISLLVPIFRLISRLTAAYRYTGMDIGRDLPKLYFKIYSHPIYLSVENKFMAT